MKAGAEADRDILDLVVGSRGVVGETLEQLNKLRRRIRVEGKLESLLQSAEEFIRHMNSPDDIPPGREQKARRQLRPLQRDNLPKSVSFSNGKIIVEAKGIRREYEPDHPAVTGKMTPVRSSNVHSVGYELNFDNPWKSRLIIRYLQRDRRHQGPASEAAKIPGPTYAYKDVPPQMFDEILDASSKGEWVWDSLRIRGTVAGHQYKYTLLSIAQRYMPRRSRVVNQRQRLVKRIGQTGQQVDSLESQNLGPYRPSVKRPNVGNRDKYHDR